MLIVIDNYDSFTYNLVQYLGELGCELQVYRHDQIEVDQIAALHPLGVVISPGPGRPDDAGISLELITRLGPSLPILGVCLGHQCIGQAFGGRIVRAPQLMHGKTSSIQHQHVGVFQGLASPFEATRYHSLVIDPTSCPLDLEITAWTLETEPSDSLTAIGEPTIMGVRHRRYPQIQGVQFHPESILTQSGKQVLANFLDQARAFHAGSLNTNLSSAPTAVVTSEIPTA